MSPSVGARIRAIALAPAEPDVRAWTSKEAAAFLAVSTKTLYRLPIPCIIIGRRTRRYLRSSIMRYMEEHSIAPL